MPKNVIATIALVIVGFLALDGFYVVSEANQAIVLRFGEFRREARDPGLHFKVPFIENIQRYDRRTLEVNSPVEEVILADQRRLKVASFARYRIIDPLRFYQTVNSETAVVNRLAIVTNAALRRVLGNVTQPEILSGRRDAIMTEIQDIVTSESQQFGVEIVDVRIERADVPDATAQAVYSRMRSEREQEANEHRARGDEEAKEIRIEADREGITLRAEAEREAKVLRGEGEAEVTRILAAAFGADEEFYAFYRSLIAYKVALESSNNSKIIITPDSEFFDYFKQTFPGGKD